MAPAYSPASPAYSPTSPTGSSVAPAYSPTGPAVTPEGYRSSVEEESPKRHKKDSVKPKRAKNMQQDQSPTKRQKRI